MSVIAISVPTLEKGENLQIPVKVYNFMPLTMNDTDHAILMEMEMDMHHSRSQQSPQAVARHVQIIRQYLGKLKITRLEAWIGGFLRATDLKEQLVIVSDWLATIDALSRYYALEADHVVITGDSPKADRMEAVTDFQDGECTTLLMTTAIAHTFLNLNTSRHLLLCDVSTPPPAFHQAQGSILHPGGKHDTVTVHIPYWQDTREERTLRAMGVFGEEQRRLNNA